MITISDDDLVQNPIIRRGSWMETVNEIHGVYPQRILTPPGTPPEFQVTGRNIYGNLGLNDQVQRDVFTSTTRTDIAQMACGYNHTMILKSDGTLWGCGNNLQGALGIGNTTTVIQEFTQESSLSTDWEYVGCGRNHTLAIKTDGTLWATGENSFGQLGQNDEVWLEDFTRTYFTTARFVAADGGWTHSAALDENGFLWTCGDPLSVGLGLNLGDPTTKQFTVVTSALNITRVQCGDQYTIVTLNNDAMYATGENESGQLGFGDTIDRYEFEATAFGLGFDWQSIAAFDATTMAVKSDGTLWGCGLNALGELGNGLQTGYLSFTQIGSDTDWDVVYIGGYHSIVQKQDGPIYGAGNSFYGSFGMVVPGYDVFTHTKIGTDKWGDIACGYQHSVGMNITQQD